jgi:hypothetical protein
MNKFDSAQFYVSEALKNCVYLCSDDRHCLANFIKGVIHFGRKDWQAAEPFFLESFQVARSLNDVRLQLDNIDYLAQIYLHLDRYSRVAEYLNIGNKIISHNDAYNLEKIKIYTRFAELYSKTRNYVKASQFQWMLCHLRDSVYNEDMTRNLMNAEARFLERENSAKILAQNEMLVLKEEIILQERVKSNILVLLALLFAAFLFLLYRDYRRKKSINSRLEKKVAERTKELQHSRDELLRALMESNIAQHRASEQLRETARTIKGLCYMGIKEISDPTALSYIRKIERSSGQLET